MKFILKDKFRDGSRFYETADGQFVMWFVRGRRWVNTQVGTVAYQEYTIKKRSNPEDKVVARTKKSALNRAAKKWESA